MQSHWFSVGSIVTWARPGVGAVATQSIVEPAYGPRLLDALAGAVAPADALAGGAARDAVAAVLRGGHAAWWVAPDETLRALFRHEAR